MAKEAQKNAGTKGGFEKQFKENFQQKGDFNANDKDKQRIMKGVFAFTGGLFLLGILTGAAGSPQP